MSAPADTSNWSKLVPAPAPAPPDPAKERVPFSWSTKKRSPTRKSPLWSVDVKNTRPLFCSITSFDCTTKLTSLLSSLPTPMYPKL